MSEPDDRVDDVPTIYARSSDGIQDTRMISPNQPTIPLSDDPWSPDNEITYCVRGYRDLMERLFSYISKITQ